MTEGDLPAVLTIEKASFPNPWSKALFESEMRNPVSFAYTLKTIKDGIESLASYVVFWMVHGEAHILNIATSPDQRRKGYARTLLEFAVEKMRRNLVYEVFLEVRMSNMAAIQLYESYGFKGSYVRKNYYGTEDALVMTLEL
jgi:ribosomal-protein-alanine N-acetyltransferase